MGGAEVRRSSHQCTNATTPLSVREVVRSARWECGDLSRWSGRLLGMHCGSIPGTLARIDSLSIDVWLTQ
jgi:hypothetical protein